MSNFDKDGAPKKYYYKVCPHCGARVHLDAEYCARCGKRAGGAKAVYSSETDPGLERPNLDHPAGCPACGLGCQYCFSYGWKEPHPKAYCGHCGGRRADCCAAARKLPTLLDILQEASEETALGDILGGKTENARAIRETWAELYAKEVENCWARNKAAAELFDKKGA
jgi:ribosomal protein L40E